MKTLRAVIFNLSPLQSLHSLSVRNLSDIASKDIMKDSSQRVNVEIVMVKD